LTRRAATWPRRQLLGLGHRLERASAVAPGLPDPRQPGQARGQARGLGELAAQRDAVGGVPLSSVQVVALVEHVSHAQVRQAGQRQRQARIGHDLERLLEGAQCPVQVCLGLPDPAQIAGDVHREIATGGRVLVRDGSSEASFSLRGPAA